MVKLIGIYKTMNAENLKSLIDEASRRCDAGDLPGALALYSRVLSEDPDNHEACLVAGSIYGETGQLAESVKLLKRATELRPGDAAGYLALAHVLRVQGDLPQAIANLENAAQACPDDAEVCCTLGSMQYEAGQLVEAIKHFERATQLDSDNAQARDMLNALLARHADMLERSGDHEQAFEVIQPLLESGNPPLGAVLVFARLSPVFDTQDDCRFLLEKISERNTLNDAERTAIQEAYSWLDRN